MSTWWWNLWHYWLRWPWRFCVITKVRPEDLYDDLLPAADGSGEVHVRMPAFERGEILLVGRNSREYGYPGRKLSKWDVGYDVFYTPWAAIARARKVVEE